MQKYHNHNKFKKNFEYIDSAKKSGFNSVKFQLFKIEKLFAKEILDNSKNTKIKIGIIEFILKFHHTAKREK